MGAKENKAIVRRFWDEYYGKKNEAVLDELVSPDYTIWTAQSGGWRALETRGPACVRQFMAGWWGGFPDLSFTITDMVAEGDKVVAVVICRGTQTGDFPFGGRGGKPIKATGKPIDLVDVVVSRLAGGKIVEEWESFNWAALRWSLGVA